MKKKLFAAILAVATLAGLESKAQDSLFTYTHQGVTLYYLLDTTGEAMLVPPMYPDMHDDGVRIETWWGYSKPQGPVVVPDSVPQGGSNHPVTTLAPEAFKYCDSITAITLPATLRVIGQQSFHGCAGLTSIVIPEGVTELGIAGFYECTGLQSVSLPTGITSIPISCFYGDTSLTSIDIPASVETIDLGAFEECTGLTSATLHQGLVTLGEYAFFMCMGLETMTLPEGLRTIGDACFFSCENLRHIDLPSTLDSVGAHAFQSDLLLDTLLFPDQLRHIGAIAMNNCPSLKYVHLPEQLEAINAWLLWGTDIESLVIPPHVTLIDTLALGNCLRLHNLTLPASVTHLGDSLFLDGTDLDTLTIESAVPPTLGDTVFPHYRTTLIVPCGSANTYRQHPAWGRFPNIEENCNSIPGSADISETEDILVRTVGSRIIVEVTEGESVRIFDMMGRLVSTADETSALPGVYLVKVGDRPTKKVVVVI